MLLEMLPGAGLESNVGAGNAPFPAVRRRMTDDEYYDRKRAERDAWNAERLAEAEPIVSAVERRCHQEHLFTRILAETGIHEEALRSLLDRTPPPEQPKSMNAGQIRSVDAWREALGKLVEWLKADAQQRNAAPLHAPTPTLKAVYSVLVEAMDHALLTVIIGACGIGKSHAATVLVDERPRSINQPGAVLVELRESDKTVSQCIETILKRLRHDLHGEGGYAGLCRVLRRGDLLILDEGHRLAKCGNGAMVEVVRDLWKDTGAGIAVIGNPLLRKRREGILGNDAYGAFLSRAEVHDFSKGNSRADVDAWMVWKGFSGKALADGLSRLALRQSRDNEGGLRELKKLVESVERRNPGKAITSEMLLDEIKLRGVLS